MNAPLKFLGFVLLVGGFLWLLEDALIGFPKEQRAAWIVLGGDIHDGLLPKSVAARTVENVVSQFNQHMSKRHRLILLPACLMLAGGITLGAQRRGAGKGASTAEPERHPAEAEREPRADERRWDNPAAWQPEEGVSFRKAMVLLARQVVVRSPFFRSRKTEEHADKDGP